MDLGKQKQSFDASRKPPTDARQLDLRRQGTSCASSSFVENTRLFAEQRDVLGDLYRLLRAA